MPYLPVRCPHQRQPRACHHALNVASHTSHDRKDTTLADTNSAASFGAKLDALDLTADEHALLADDAEVTGYTTSFTGMLSGMTLNRPMPRPGSTNIMSESGNGGI